MKAKATTPNTANPTTGSPHVTVCICTCQRPAGLSRLLRALERVDWDGALRVVVVDNDAGYDGIEVCKSLDNYRWELIWGFEPRRGISFARNRAATLALSRGTDYIAMLDDDEWPARDWLTELLRLRQRTGADVVGGPVQPVFPDAVGNWVERVRDCYGANLPQPDGARCMLYACGNFIARAECFQALQPEFFKPEFAFSGGEDYVFFRQLDELGFSLHWSTRALAYEEVPPSRLSLDWIRRRMILKGNIQIRMFRLYDPGLSRELWRWTKTCGLAAIGTARCLLGLVHYPSRVEGSLMLWRARGRAQAHFGRTLTRPDQIEGA